MNKTETETKQFSSVFLQKWIQYIGKPEIRERIQLEILDPLVDHIMRRVFPYIILTCVLFVLLLIAVLLTLGIIIFRPVVATSATVSAAALP